MVESSFQTVRHPLRAGRDFVTRHDRLEFGGAKERTGEGQVMNPPESQARLTAIPQSPAGLRIVRVPPSEASPEGEGLGNHRRVRGSSECRPAEGPVGYSRLRVRVPSHAALRGFYDGEGPSERQNG